jgi:hypothetical protein
VIAEHAHDVSDFASLPFARGKLYSQSSAGLLRPKRRKRQIRIDRRPAGEYEIVAWHKGWNVLRREIVMDVLSQQRVPRPSSSVHENDKAMVNFVISEK